MASTVIPIAFEVTADAEIECASACYAIKGAQPAGIITIISELTHCGDQRWRAIIRLRREPPIATLPDWCGEG